jgi:hypothetical protein
MVNSMEEFWKDPELTFHQVKYAEDQFGRNGFKAIEKERVNSSKKEFDKTAYNGCRLFKVLRSLVFCLLCCFQCRFILIILNIYLYCSRLLYFHHSNDLFMDNESQD